MRIEKFVRKQGLVLKYTCVTISTQTIGERSKKRRRTTTTTWKCDILSPIFDIPILVEKKGPEGIKVTIIWEPKETWASRQEARTKLMARVTGRTMTIKDLSGHRTVQIPPDLE